MEHKEPRWYRPESPAEKRAYAFAQKQVWLRNLSKRKGK